MKTKRAEKLAGVCGVNSQTHPALSALVEFACRNPKLNLRNYATPGDRHWRDGLRAYQAESRAITRQLGRFAKAVAEAMEEGVSDAGIIEAAPGAFGGRLSWDGNGWDYCVGQYFPTEYRNAASAVVEAATHAVRRSRPERVGMPRTMAELRSLNRDNGYHWFSPGAMRFFGTRIESGIINGRLFVTSEKPPHGPRAYTVREFDDHGCVDTVGELCGHATRAEAIAAAKKGDQ